MGEDSKSIGEQGELIVRRFLELIGWVAYQSNIPINCMHSIEHKSTTAKKERKTHGIDYFYANKSNLKINTLDNIVISVKYSASEYPKYPSTKFKEHITDLSQTLECFIRSNLRTDSIAEFNDQRSIKKADDLGVLFWINNCKKSQQNIVKEVANIEIPKELKFSKIYLVDNSRVSFIHKTITYLKNKYENHEVNFHYNQSDANFSDPDIIKYGTIMPVEYLTADIIPFRLINDQETIFGISINDNFSEENLNSILAYASDISQDFTNELIILFPDYDNLEHKNIYEKVAGRFNKKQNRTIVKIHSFQNEFWSLGDE
ncbi:hypothetical protein [Shewanella sp. SG41-3]|uniref:GapS4a family protein n=1 Tax=Shewanella sp. SG41-3 TaxID=2760977 RepID=UPI001601B547|nr:hypothetical protein [Shewanella sp. SG41-3]MBB1475063.1 hypothetical protein [Shewanella sp. SG41-3]